MGIEEILGEKREEILRIAEKHGVTSIRVFGSVARGDAGTDSDVDLPALKAQITRLLQ